MNSIDDKGTQMDIDTQTPPWLTRHIESLPKELTPSRDLWSGIAERLDSHPKQKSRAFNQGQYAAVASVLVMVASVVFSWQSYQYQRDAEQRLADAELVLRHIEAPYAYARVSYEKEWQYLRETLPKETADTIDANLYLIREAQTKISAALKKEPDNIELQGLLYRTLSQEISVYKHAERVREKTQNRADLI